MEILLLVVALVAAVGVGAAVVVARRAGAAYARSNEILPGVPTSAPPAWAGSHDPEARLHRRLRDAMAALRANQAFDDDGGLLDLRVELEHQAVALDEQLVAVAALPVHLRAEPLAGVAAAVASIELAVSELAGSSVAEAADRMAGALADVRIRTDLVSQARVELDRLDDIAATPAPSSEPGPAGGAPSAEPGVEPPPSSTARPGEGPAEPGRSSPA